jgi:hypothetical protein
MRNVSIYLIIVEFLDILTTTIGLENGVKEINPFAVYMGFEKVLLVKILTTVFVIFVLEKKKPNKYDVLVPGVILFFVIWNIINIVLG